MKVYIASDHAGFELKKALVEHLKVNGHEVEDLGAESLNEADDYPDFVIPCVEKVASDFTSLGIVIGGSGQGEAIAANKVKGIRAALYYGGDLDIVKLSREHNLCNVLSLGARFLSVDKAKESVDLWLSTPAGEEERHKRRIGKINAYES